MAEQPTITVKVGATFEAAGCQLLLEDEPVNLSEWGIRTQIRTMNQELVAEPQVQITDDGLSFNIVSPGNEEQWPVGRLLWDVRYQDQNGVVVFSETIIVNAIRRETWDE